MNPAPLISDPRAVMASLASGLLLSGCYYGYPPYPGGYYSPVVPAAYTQREFTLPQGASGTAAAVAPASGVAYSSTAVQSQYAVASPTADYYAVTIRCPHRHYPAYYGYPYAPVSGAFGFGYWAAADATGAVWMAQQRLA
ncbi:hypothetical protein BUMB_00045 [Candidatus Paraburkholderia calva]|nr:hypothetical protein BUMB_00045 [Candidatus Paraburkholderia calva]